MKTPPPKDTLDDIFDREFLVMTENYMAEDERTHSRKKYIGRSETIEAVKQQILTHYISYEEVNMLLEDETNRWGGTLGLTKRQINRNALRAELKAALKKRRDVI